MHDPRVPTALRQLADLGDDPPPSRWSWAVVGLERIGRIRLPAAAIETLGAGDGREVWARSSRLALVLRPQGPGARMALDERGRIYLPWPTRRPSPVQPNGPGRCCPRSAGSSHAAGIVAVEPIGSIDFAGFQRVLDVNLTAFARVTQLLLDDLEAANPGSAVVGIASTDAIVGHAVSPAYCSSKAGMLGLTRSMAAALGPRRIRVNAVCPGYVETPMLAPGLAVPGIREQFTEAAALKRIGQPEDIAGVVRFLLSDDAAFVTGQSVVADGGLTTTV